MANGPGLAGPIRNAASSPKVSGQGAEVVPLVNIGVVFTLPLVCDNVTVPRSTALAGTANPTSVTLTMAAPSTNAPARLSGDLGFFTDHFLSRRGVTLARTRFARAVRGCRGAMTRQAVQGRRRTCGC